MGSEERGPMDGRQGTKGEKLLIKHPQLWLGRKRLGPDRLVMRVVRVTREV